MEPADIYRNVRERLLHLAPTLSTDQLCAPLAATPPWQLLDGYRHLAGVCANVLDGAMDGAGTPDWTAAQLSARAGASLADVCSEWQERAPELDAKLAAAGRAMSFVAFDAWTHAPDIRAAAGLPGERDNVADALAELAIETVDGRYRAKGVPALLVDLGGSRAALGDGEPHLTLRTTSYAVLRMIFGRRSRAQMAAADWSGDPSAAVHALHIFDLPADDIID